MTSQPAPIKSLLRGLPVLQGAHDESALDSLGETPHAAFQKWLSDAIEAGVREPHAMTLSTVDSLGFPDARVLILKNVDERGWHFAVKSTSPKGQHIAGNPRVALTFYWPEICRQVRIRGSALRLPDEECRQDFAQRPLGSRISAMASNQSQVLLDAGDLLKSRSIAEEIFSQNPDTILSDWAVYAVTPIEVEFWQGQADRQHKRLKYVLRPDDQSWGKAELWP
ncbi:unnamed protein product [Clonostachys byssicola]|uniref:pyridoxal 5'-phosphate synthase n=1 Tax=Clonostachys byssicola TaxID=160290 RepID=A0A9N9XVF5_9HYPO|nr:unnamed protein product [Clonostachys byssicola]